MEGHHGGTLCRALNLPSRKWTGGMSEKAAGRPKWLVPRESHPPLLLTHTNPREKTCPYEENSQLSGDISAKTLCKHAWLRSVKMQHHFWCGLLTWLEPEDALSFPKVKAKSHEPPAHYSTHWPPEAETKPPPNLVPTKESGRGCDLRGRHSPSG